MDRIVIESSLRNRSRLYTSFLAFSIDQISEVSESIKKCQELGGTIFLAGNGGSAAEAQHFAGELIGRYRKARLPLPAVSLNADTSVLTCIANDFGYSEVFSRQLEALAKPEDLFIAFTTSGNSQNIIRALEAAEKKGCKSVVFTGQARESQAQKLADITLVAPSRDTAEIQEYHLACIHILSGIIENFIKKEERINITEENEKIEVNEIINFRDIAEDSRALAVIREDAVFLNGCFDLLHAGHFKLLRFAQSLRRKLIVGLNSDSSIKKLKGDSRPINSVEVRARNLIEFGCIDNIIVFDETNPLQLINKLKPEVIVKGDEYSEVDFPEKKFVESYGGTFVYMKKLEGFSTSSMVQKFHG